MADYVRTAGDLAHSFYSTLLDGNGPVDLPVGATVNFESRLLGATVSTTNSPALVIEPGAAVGDPNRGLVRFDPAPTDVQAAGVYFIKWKVQFPDQPTGYLQSFPEASYEVLVLNPAI